jgi:hypothetical protein
LLASGCACPLPASGGPCKGVAPLPCDMRTQWESSGIFSGASSQPEALMSPGPPPRTCAPVVGGGYQVPVAASPGVGTFPTMLVRSTHCRWWMFNLLRPLQPSPLAPRPHCRLVALTPLPPFLPSLFPPSKLSLDPGPPRCHLFSLPTCPRARSPTPRGPMIIGDPVHQQRKGKKKAEKLECGQRNGRNSVPSGCCAPQTQLN